MLLLSLFGALSLEDRGMEITPAAIGGCYVAFGLVSLTFQLFIYKRLHKKLGLYRLYLAGTLLLGIAAALLPMAGLIKGWEVREAQQDWVANHPASSDPSSSGEEENFDPKSLSWRSFWVSWCYMGLSLTGMASGFMICLPVVGGMMSLAVQGSSFRGLTLGVSQSLMSGCRGAGAAIMGGLFSYVARKTAWPAAVFWLLACLNLTAFIVAFKFFSFQTSA